jgi:hypothetical protein
MIQGHHFFLSWLSFVSALNTCIWIECLLRLWMRQLQWSSTQLVHRVTRIVYACICILVSRGHSHWVSNCLFLSSLSKWIRIVIELENHQLLFILLQLWLPTLLNYHRLIIVHLCRLYHPVQVIRMQIVVWTPCRVDGRASIRSTSPWECLVYYMHLHYLMWN